MTTDLFTIPPSAPSRLALARKRLAKAQEEYNAAMSIYPEHATIEDDDRVYLAWIEKNKAENELAAAEREAVDSARDCV